VPQQVERLGPEVEPGRGVDDPRQPLGWEQPDGVVEAVLVLEHERRTQHRLVVQGADRGGDRVVGHEREEPAHRHVLVSCSQLLGDRHHDLRGHLGDDLRRTPWVQMDGDVRQELGRQPLRDVDGLRGIGAPRGAGAEHRPEGALGDGRHQSGWDQLGRGGCARQPGRGREQPVRGPLP
jgi:hypothetical protein